jgi:hypothetical protein
MVGRYNNSRPGRKSGRYACAVVSINGRLRVARAVEEETMRDSFSSDKAVTDY